MRASATDDLLLSPHFFRRTSEGWQFDMRAEVRTPWPSGRRRQLGMFRSGDVDDLTFGDQIQRVSYALRLRHGENRPLPTLHPEWSGR